MEPGRTLSAGLPRGQQFMLAASMFLCVAAFGFLEPFVPLYLELSGLTRAQIGLVAGAGAALTLLIQPLLGRLSDLLDARRPLMIVVALLTGGAYLAYRAADHLLFFMLLTALGVNGITFLNTANSVLVSRLAERGAAGKQTAAFAKFRVWGSVGYVVVSLLSGLLLTRTLGGGAATTRSAIDPIFTYGPLLFFLVAAITGFLPDPKRAALARVAGSTPSPKPVASTRGRQGSERNFRWFLTAYFLYSFAWTGSAAYLSLHLRSLGATPTWITAVYTTGVLCEIAVMAQVGRWSDHFGRRPLLAVALGAMPLRLLLYAPATHPLQVLLIQMLHGINFGVLVTVAVAFVNDLCTEETRGAAQARLAACNGFAAAIGPACCGWMAGTIGIPAMFCVMSLVAAIGVAWFVWKVRESHPDPVRLHRQGPAVLRPVFRILSLPGARLKRLPRRRRPEE